MSVNLEAKEQSVEKTSKKRKHEGEVKESKKKRKQASEPIEANGVDRPDQESATKEKSKKIRSKVTEGIVERPKSEVNGTPGLEDPSKKEKRKKKRKDSSEEPVEPDAKAPVSQKDFDVPDAPPLEEDILVDSAHKNTNTAQDESPEGMDYEQLNSKAPSSFHSTRMSLYLPIPPIGLDKGLASVLALHITPLLLTYFPPAGGVVLSIHDPVLSATPQGTLNQPLLPPGSSGKPKDLPYAYPRVGEEFGSCWAWLTVTFLVYCPQPGDELEGYTNAMSEGFVGIVCYNYFQTSVAKSRIPKTWSWDGPAREARQRKTPRKGRLNDGEEASQDSHLDSQETVVAREDDAIDGFAGIFLDGEGSKISDRLRFRVVDLEMIPAQERGQLALHVEGTLLNAGEEAAVKAEEHEQWQAKMDKIGNISRTPGTPMMSGGVAIHSRAGSVTSAA